MICELIILKKPKVEKGCGFHLDALVISLINLGAGFFGTCWLSCATLKVLAHLMALTVWSKNDPPGQEPKIICVLEQRVTGFVMSIFLGLSVFMAPVLKYISMSVLFGVFLYMGISSLTGNQLFERIFLFFIPTNQHPQVEYVRRVPTWKIHLYTIIQLGLLAILWGVKSIKQIALFFPIVLMLLVPVRLNLTRIFTENQLDALDGDGSKPKAEEGKEAPIEKA
jgi:solute carrier family 4 anion exchanger 2